VSQPSPPVPQVFDEMRRAQAVVRENAGGVAAHDGGKTGELLGLNGPRVHATKKTDDFGSFDAAGKNFFHGLFGFGAR